MGPVASSLVCRWGPRPTSLDFSVAPAPPFSFSLEAPVGSLGLSFQNVPPAPGREQQGTTAAPAAPPPAGAPQQEPGLGPLLPMLLMIVPLLLIMMWGSRSQQKKQQVA